jgi:NAD(P) transhydrogenase subunit alpha
MIISALREMGNETRVAITPTTVREYIALGHEVNLEYHAGQLAGFHDEDYQAAGALLFKDRKTLLQNTQILLCISEPDADDLKGLAPESLLIGPIDNHPRSEMLEWGLQHRISIFSTNYIPPIRRAETIDAISTQASLAGYRAMLESITHFKRSTPLMSTIDNIPPVHVLVLGTDIAGTQAIATAKQLGAMVYAFDLHPAAKSHVERLGALFIEPQEPYPLATLDECITPANEEYRRLQAELIDEYARCADIIICTVQIPGKNAPILLRQSTVDHMKPGSVVVDMVTTRGGNCVLSEANVTFQHGEVTIIGHENFACLVPTTASELYANNALNIVRLITAPSEKLIFNEEDEILRACMLCHDGQYLPYQSGV